MKQYLRYLFPALDPEVNSWTIEARLLHWLTWIWLAIGLVTLFSASYPEGVVDHHDGFYFLKRQFIGIAIGLVGFQLVIRQSLRRLFKLAPWLVLWLWFLILLTLVPGLSKSTLGASRWLAIGGFSLQPSELIKPFLVLQTAYLLAKWQKLDSSVRIFWLIIFGGILGAILKQPNLSTTALCGMSLWLMAVAAELPWSQLLTTAFGGLSLATVSIYLNPYQWNRIVFFLDPWQDYHNKGYQLIQSLLAIATGGWSGSGFGLSQQKLYYLPISSTDFIFAVFAEEFGFLGCMLLLLLILGYATLALRVALKCRVRRQQLAAVGVMVFLVGQSLINVGVATGSLPTTGLPLPFFSYGTNSMIASLVLAGILIRVAREINQAEVIPSYHSSSSPTNSRSSFPN